MKGPKARREFEATIEAGRGGGALVAIPFDVEEVYGTRGRLKIKATFDGHSYRGSIAPMGGRHLLGVTKVVREAIGKSVGDPVAVVLELDTDERQVEVPAELAEALATNREARRFFDGLAFTYRKEYAHWIASAKRPETRVRRLGQAIDQLSRGEKL